LGFDISGISARGEKGRFISINVWGWRPFWHILCKYTESLTEVDRIKGHLNDGHAIEGKKHHDVLITLRWLVGEKPRRVEFEATPPSFGVKLGGKDIETLDPMIFSGRYSFSWDIVTAFLSFCEENDGFIIR